MGGVAGAAALPRRGHPGAAGGEPGGYMRRSPLLGADGARRAVLPLAPAAVEGFVPDFAHTPPATLCLPVGDGYRDGAMRRVADVVSGVLGARGGGPHIKGRVASRAKRRKLRS